MQNWIERRHIGRGEGHFVRLELKPSVTAGVRQNDIKLILLRQQT